jgi:hypothetical protein
MTQIVDLHQQEHSALRILTRRGAAYGDAIQFCLTFPLEFRDVLACYPIVFRRIDEAPGWAALALFGLQPGENLFLGNDGEGWNAPYIPSVMMHQPFTINMRSGRYPMQIDLDHPRVGHAEGEALFLKYGGTSEYMEQMVENLSTVLHGIQNQAAFFDEMSALGLLVPFTAEFDLACHRSQRLEGFYAVDEDKLKALPAMALDRLNKAGHLEAAYLALASMSNLRKLVTRKERRNASHP